MLSPIKSIRLWISRRRELENKRHALRLVRGTEGPILAHGVDVNKIKKDLCSVKKVYQENAIILDNLGYKRLTLITLDLKETTSRIEEIVRTWEGEER